MKPPNHRLLAIPARLATAALFLTASLLPPAVGGDAPSATTQRWRGVFEPRAQATIPAEVSMRVARMPGLPGTQCAEGELLVEFDAAIAEAALAAAKSKRTAANQNHLGLKSLFEKHQASAVEVARAESELAHADLELAAAERDLAACRVLAPFAGRIVEHNVREHEWASRGSPLLLLVDDGALLARFFLPEESFSRIAPGNGVRIWVPAVARSVSGEVTRLGAVFDPVSRTFDAWALVPNPANDLRAGMTAEVEWPPQGDEE